MSNQKMTMSFDEVRAMMSQLGQKAIAFHVSYAKLTGSVGAGLMLSQAVFWTTTYGRHDDGWFYQTYKQWGEATLLTRRDLDAARKKLAQLEWNGMPLWQEHKRSQPAKLHYRVDLFVLAKLVSEIKDDESVQTSPSGEADDESVQTSTAGEADAESVQTSTADVYKLGSEFGTNKNIDSVQTKERQKEIQRETERERSAKADGTPTDTDEPIEVSFVNLGRHSMAEAGLQPDGTPTAVPVSVQPEQGGSASTEPRPDANVYGLVDAYFEAQGIAKRDVPKSTRAQVKKVLADLPDAYSREDVYRCVTYMLTDQWNREPGRLTAKRVVVTLPQWVAQGRPEARAPSGAQHGRKPSGDDWRHVARQLREQR